MNSVSGRALLVVIIIWVVAMFAFFPRAHADPFQSPQEFASQVAHDGGTKVGPSVAAPMRLSGAVPDMIVSAAHASGLGGFAPALVRIAKIESGLRCSPGGNGGGLFQFTRGTRARLGVTNPRSCVANINAAMRYARGCVAQGARTAAQLGACWNSGSPFTARRHLERPYRIARL